MTPPPAEELVPRLFLGPALRAQSDRRLVRLVRDGYEAAFDEIMRRYGGALRRYAGAIVGGRAEDVIQEAFSKALQALRRDERAIELRPWLYRIVRNTALNDLRDRHPVTVALGEGIVGTPGVAEEVERREEVGELLDRLRALPEPQRAAIVMRELEGLGHEEIAATLGVSDGAARQAIHRARTALRNGLGMAIPLPVLRAMLGTTSATEIAVGGAGAGLALKAATATVLVAGSFGAGVALHQSRQTGHVATAAAKGPSPRAATATPRPAADDRRDGVDRRSRDDGQPRGGAAGPGPSRVGEEESGTTSARGPGRGPSRETSPSGPRSGERHSSGSGGSEGGGERSGSGQGAQTGDGGGGGSESGSGDSSGSSGSGDGSGSGELSGSGESLESNSGPGSGSDGGGGDGESGSGSGDSRDSSSDGGFSGQMQLQPEEER